MSYRGPGVGTSLRYNGTMNFSAFRPSIAASRGYGMIDRDYDILGGPAPVNNFRPDQLPRHGCWIALTIEDMPYGFSVHGTNSRA